MTRSLQLAVGYSAAMAIPGTALDLIMGIVLLILLVALVLTSWFGSPNWRGRTNRMAIVAAGIFLAWKEGFTRAAVHGMVFFVDALFLAALLPVLLEQPTNTHPDDDLNQRREPKRGRLEECVPALSAACILICFANLVLFHKEFKAAVRDGLVARNINTLTAFFRPATFRLELGRHLKEMRDEAALPEIRAIVGGSTVDAMNLDQDVVILNGLNYVPHPVFENYAAYTPALQRLNSGFFNSQKAPEYLLWHTGSIDGRFPTLDDGEVLLRILRNYSPVTQEKGYLLWRRNSARETSYCLSDERESYGSLNRWVPIPRQPTWLRIECKQTLFGAIRGLLYRPSELRLEARLDDGETRDYRLLSGNAQHGFVISPFLRADYQLIEAARPFREFPADPTALPKTFDGEPPRIVAVRVRAANDFAYKHNIRFVTQTIEGIWPVHGQSLPTESKEISKAR
jgi:hypothetical protein